MRIVHLVHNFPPEFRGGTEACVETLARAQLRRGDEVTVVCGSEQRQAGGGLLEESLEGLPVKRVLRLPGEHYAVDHRLPRVASQVVDLVARLEPDVVHLHHWMNLSGDLAARLAERGLTVVATLHDYALVCARLFLTRPDGESCAAHFPLPGERCVACLLPAYAGDEAQVRHELAARRESGAAEALALALCIVPGQGGARRWRASGLLREEQLAVLAHPTPLAARPAPPARSRADGRLVLITWGHLAPAKGVLDLLEALRRAADPRLELLVLGQPVDAAFAEELLDAAEGLPVTFVGPYEADELTTRAAQADLAVFPSRAEETFGLVVAEARALGLPVLTSDRGALAEALGGAGESLPAADPAALARRLVGLADEPEPLAAWRAASRDGLLDPDAHAAAVAALYRRALAPTPGGTP